MTKRTIPGVIILMLVGQLSALAQGLLPNSSGGWTATGNANMVAPAQLESVAADRADVLREYGVSSAEQRQYTQGQQTVTVTLYRMTDPSAAYGAFTFMRDVQMGDLDLGDSVAYAASDKDKALFVVGNLLAASGGGQRIPDALLSDLAAALLPHADRRPYPTISGYLPHSSVAAGTQKFPLRPGGATVALPARMSLVPESERYLLGPRAVRAAIGDRFPATTDDWMGFHFSAEAVAARYQPAGRSAPEQQVTLLLAMYPTQQIAAKQFAGFGKWLALNVAPDQAGGRPVVYGSRSSALVALVFGAESEDAAKQLMSQVQYHTDITWNEPGRSLTDPSFPVMIVGVFEGTGLILLLAIAVGLGFGGFRLLIKIVLPGRVFDRDNSVEILQLGLTTKPIDSRDFY